MEKKGGMIRDRLITAFKHGTRYNAPFYGDSLYPLREHAIALGEKQFPSPSSLCRARDLLRQNTSLEQIAREIPELHLHINPHGSLNSMAAMVTTDVHYSGAHPHYSKSRWTVPSAIASVAIDIGLHPHLALKGISHYETSAGEHRNNTLKALPEAAKVHYAKEPVKEDVFVSVDLGDRTGTGADQSDSQQSLAIHREVRHRINNSLLSSHPSLRTGNHWVAGDHDLDLKGLHGRRGERGASSVAEEYRTLGSQLVLQEIGQRHIFLGINSNLLNRGWRKTLTKIAEASIRRLIQNHIIDAKFDLGNIDIVTINRLLNQYLDLTPEDIGSLENVLVYKLAQQETSLQDFLIEAVLRDRKDIIVGGHRYNPRRITPRGVSVALFGHRHITANVPMSFSVLPPKLSRRWDGILTRSVNIGASDVRLNGLGIETDLKVLDMRISDRKGIKMSWITVKDPKRN
ncbi:MAG: hypothetical protein V1922_04255 [bacterium]